MKGILRLVVVAAALIAGAAYLAPGPVAGAIAWFHSQIGFTPETCAAAPEQCFAARQESLETARIKLHHARGQAEAGVHAIDAEEGTERQLLDSNVGLQAVLRTRASEMIQSGADHLSFEGRTYTRPEVEQQAAILVREEAGFRATLGEFGPRRTRLNEARTQAVVEENRVSAALATVNAEKAIVIATGSLDHAKHLLEETQFAENIADQVDDAVVRSTREMAPPPDRTAAISGGPAFSFDAWLSGNPAKVPAPVARPLVSAPHAAMPPNATPDDTR